MFRPRVIPVLLLKGSTLVKSRQFRDHRYIGDPINAVRLFNDMKADELAFFDILATRDGRGPSIDLIKSIGEEANMPFAVGGGIRTVADIQSIIGAGAEKVVIGTAAATDPGFIRQASQAFGASTIAVCIDVRRDASEGNRVWIRNAEETTQYLPTEFARLMEDAGVGELIVQSVERDGMMTGYDIALVGSISRAVSVPVIALGGAGTLDDMRQARNEGHASALAAGSMFVYHGLKKGVLISYPEKAEIPF